MRKSIKKLILATLSMLLLVFTFTVTTYAWVTINNTSEIGEIQFSTVDEANYMISVDNVNFGKTIYVQDIYEALSKQYPDAFRKDDAYVQRYGRYRRVETYQYQYKYRLITPLATEDGFVNSFYKMNHSVVDDHTEFIFENLTALINEQGAVEEVYNPEDGYLKFTIYIKSDINSHLYLLSSNISYNDSIMSNDITSSSMVRVGFESEMYSNLSKTVTVDGSDYTMKHLKIYEPVTTLPSNVYEYVEGYLENTTGVGKYFSTSYIDDYVADMRRNILNWNETLSRFVFNDSFRNDYGTDSFDKLYSFEHMNDVINNKKSNVTRIIVEQNGDDYNYVNLDEATPLMELVAGESQAITVYIWLEGWDGAAGDFSQLGRFNLSFNFIEVER